MKGHLDVQEAVKTAKMSLLEAFTCENPYGPRLEEIRLDGTTWKITIGANSPS